LAYALDPVFTPLQVGAIIVVALIVLTRALHIEGFMDSCDGLFGGFTRERRLEIMRDPRVGSFAAIGAISLLLVKWTLIVGIADQYRTPLLVLFPGVSRAGMLLGMEVYPYARDQGMGTSFKVGSKLRQVIIGLVLVGIASALLLGIAGVVLLGIVCVIALGFGRWVTGLLGGMTGDTYGAVNEIGEVTALIAAVVLLWAAPGLFWSWGLS
ncbi:MAG: adenosylcobinamide-GDP ribazoletransferase, partial [Chloroflexi bacterium]|nr:adenosylcobinamide-GDP ribazoletransferase [Chloroflexota bacterium]